MAANVALPALVMSSLVLALSKKFNVLKNQKKKNRKLKEFTRQSLRHIQDIVFQILHFLLNFAVFLFRIIHGCNDTCLLLQKVGFGHLIDLPSHILGFASLVTVAGNDAFQIFKILVFFADWGIDLILLFDGELGIFLSDKTSLLLPVEIRNNVLEESFSF